MTDPRHIRAIREMQDADAELLHDERKYHPALRLMITAVLALFCYIVAAVIWKAI